MSTVRVENFRETIGGIEVVDAAFADKLLGATIKVMDRHREWRSAQDAYYADPENKALRNKLSQKRSLYRKARWMCWKIVEEAAGVTNTVPM